MGDVALGELHDAHREGSNTVIRDDAFADPQTPAAADPADREMPIRRVTATLLLDSAATAERLSRVSWKLRWRAPPRTGREVGVGRPPRHHRQGTAVTKKYQKQKIDTPAGDGFVVLDQVRGAMAEIAGSMLEGLLALAVGTGLQVMQALMEADVTALAGPKGRHDPQRAAVRHGHERGAVTLGGRRVPVTRPRVRAADGTGELSVA